MNKLVAGWFAEFVGTFAFVFVGAASILHHHDGGSILPVALAHGLILSIMVTATMHISGGQLNPAVSLALAAIKKQSFGRALLFISAQLVGSVLAALLLKELFSEQAVEAGKLGATVGTLSNATGSAVWHMLILEGVATFFLMFAVLGTAVDPRGVGGNKAVGGFAIGLTVACCILCIGPLTGASMNPARSFGPALVGGIWAGHWDDWIAPIAGATIAAILWKLILEEKKA